MIAHTRKTGRLEFNILINNFAQIFWARILKFSLAFSLISDPDMHRKHGSSVVSALASGARGPRFDPRSQRGKFWSL